MKLHKIWTRDYDVYLCYGASRGLYNNKKLLLYATKEVFIFPNGKNREIYLTLEDYQNQWTALENHYINKINNFILYTKELLNAGKKFVKKCKEFSKNVSILNNKDLVKRYKEFEKEFVKYFIYLWSSFILNELITTKITVAIEELSLNKEEKHELLVYATQPIMLASIMLLAQEAKTKNIKQLTKDFIWITTLNIYDNPATEEDIKNRISDKENKITKPSTFSKLSNNIQLLVEASRNNAYIKDRRDDYRRMGTYYIIPLYEEIGKRLNLTRKELSFLTPNEIENGLLRRTEFLKEKANKREEHGFMMWWHNNKLDFEDDLSKINKIKDKLGISDKIEKEVGEFKGVIGCKGRIIGKIKVITTVKELNKIQKGDIMVAVTTNPDYLPGMERASAFVTDEGGMTCHAAIVAREMKKPCIVGTKIATLVLKDNDEVEINANHGVIRVIKKAK